MAGQADEAMRVIADARASVIPGTDASVEFAEMAGELLMDLGRNAAAVQAFGPPAALSPYARRMRRRAWWRSGGPFRRRRVPITGDAKSAASRAAVPGSGGVDSVTAERTTPAETLTRPSDGILESAAWAMWLSGEARHDEARQVVNEAMTLHGRHPVLLACAARIALAAKARNTALFLWHEAYQQAPDDVDIVCGLAEQIARISNRYFYDPRVRDALQVLDGFPDQAHPAIREARYWLLRRNSPSAARLAAALGPGDGLPEWLGRRRHELLLRSAGPVGQFCVKVFDAAHDRRYPRPESPVQGIEAESEEIAQILDAAHPLEPAAAIELIEDSMRQHGRQPSLLLAYAKGGRV